MESHPPVTFTRIHYKLNDSDGSNGHDKDWKINFQFSHTHEHTQPHRHTYTRARAVTGGRHFGMLAWPTETTSLLPPVNSRVYVTSWNGHRSHKPPLQSLQPVRHWKVTAGLQPLNHIELPLSTRDTASPVTCVTGTAGQSRSVGVWADVHACVCYVTMQVRTSHVCDNAGSCLITAAVIVCRRDSTNFSDFRFKSRGTSSLYWWFW